MPWTCITCEGGKKMVCGPDPQCVDIDASSDGDWKKIGCFEVTVCIGVFRNPSTGAIELKQQKCKKCHKGLP